MTSHTTKPVALVTGTSSGIGLHTALGLAKAGVQVIATVRGTSNAEQLRDHHDVEIRALDICDAQAVESCIASIISSHGRLDILVNNAGAGLLGSTEQLSVADFEACLNVNFLGAVRLTKAVLPAMRRAGAGRIVNVTSIGGLVGQPFNDAYCAAKFAMEGWTESLAPVLRLAGIEAVLVEPGAVATRFVDKVRPQLESLLARRNDPLTGLLLEYVSTVGTWWAPQTPEEAAAVVVRAALSDDPSFRTMTNDDARRLDAIKRGDPSGNALVETTMKWLHPSDARPPR